MLQFFSKEIFKGGSTTAKGMEGSSQERDREGPSTLNPARQFPTRDQSQRGVIREKQSWLQLFKKASPQLQVLAKVHPQALVDEDVERTSRSNRWELSVSSRGGSNLNLQSPQGLASLFDLEGEKSDSTPIVESLHEIFVAQDVPVSTPCIPSKDEVRAVIHGFFSIEFLLQSFEKLKRRKR